MSPDHKIIYSSDLDSWNVMIGNNAIVVCYGHFNIIHPGHIRYLEFAKTLNGKLVVAIQGDQMLTYSGNYHYFSAKERALGLALINIVDLVLILDKGDLKNALNKIGQCSLVLGKEFEEERKHKIKDALEVLKKVNGKVIYHAGQTNYATTDLLRNENHDLTSIRWSQFKKACLLHNMNLLVLQKALSRFHNSRLLILGDTIVDQYIACDAMGMSAEAPVLVVRELRAREYLGGAQLSLPCQIIGSKVSLSFCSWKR